MVPDPGLTPLNTYAAIADAASFRGIWEHEGKRRILEPVDLLYAPTSDTIRRLSPQ